MGLDKGLLKYFQPRKPSFFHNEMGYGCRVNRAGKDEAALAETWLGVRTRILSLILFVPIPHFWRQPFRAWSISNDLQAPKAHSANGRRSGGRAVSSTGWRKTAWVQAST